MNRKEALNKRFVDKVAALIKDRTIRHKREMADVLEWNESALNSVMAGRRPVPEEKADKLFKLYPDAKQVLQLNVKHEGVPVYNIEATAGSLEFLNDMPELIQGYINLPNFKDCVAFLYIRGSSMYPKFVAGDLVGVVPMDDLKVIQYGQVHLIITNNNQRMVKFVRKGNDENHLILRSENKDYDDIPIEKSYIRKMFMVKGPIRDDWQ